MQSQRLTSIATSAPSADLDIGVIYTGERHFIRPLVASLAASGDGLTARLILVDNASRDGVTEWTRAFADTRVVKNEKRLGYAANLNRILAVATARYVLLLNTDMYFDPAEQCLAKMAQFMDAHPRCGVSICRVYHPDGTYGHPSRRYPSWRVVAARRLGLSRWYAKTLDEYLYLDRDPRSSFACEWVSGCFLLVRREAVQDVGPFDERFVKYFEDVDMCLRMSRAGWQVMFHGATYCYHHEQRASHGTLSRDAWRHALSYLRWLMKWGFTTYPALPAGPPPADAQVKLPGMHRAPQTVGMPPSSR